jgi:hypothetical protein
MLVKTPRHPLIYSYEKTSTHSHAAAKYFVRISSETENKPQKSNI